jgi:Tfp pilus assembly protein PilZ
MGNWEWLLKEFLAIFLRVNLFNQSSKFPLASQVSWGGLKCKNFAFVQTAHPTFGLRAESLLFSHLKRLDF